MNMPIDVKSSSNLINDAFNDFIRKIHARFSKGELSDRAGRRCRVGKRASRYGRHDIAEGANWLTDCAP